MKIRLVNLAILILFVIAVCGCFSETEEISMGTESSVETEIKNIKNKVKPEKNAENNDSLENLLNSMSLEEKVGQMMMIGVHGKEVNNDISYLLNEYKVGGIIFYDRNMDSRAQVKKFSAEIQDIALNSDKKIPLFISIDEEGGRVSRMQHDLTPPPSQEEIGQSGDYGWAKETAETTAKKLRDIGINLNFAPVADVGSRDTRSFSDNGDIVAEFVSSAAQGYENEKFFYCLKHFPGIGLAKVDPHQDISTVDISREDLEKVDLLPFRKIISERDNSKFMVMVGHLKYPAIDPNNAASLSPLIVTDILRKELNFTGVVITDDLNMGAVSNYNGIESIVIQAIKSGADIILICHEYELQKRACDEILNAVKRGEITEKRIDDSVRRILKMKANL